MNLKGASSSRRQVLREATLPVLTQEDEPLVNALGCTLGDQGAVPSSNVKYL